ncbi:MAG: hypothetical protein ACRET0_13765 [Steroidobacteraceae bacterium]
MPIKRILRVERLRRVPAQFSWIDQRLVREHYIERCDTTALALYLLLATVADAQGLSYYSDRTVCRLLSIPPAHLAPARAQLLRAELIAYEAPLYQLLALQSPSTAFLAPAPAARTGGLQSIGSTLDRVHQRLRTS